MVESDRTTFFDAYGPFELDRDGGRLTGSQPQLWASLDEKWEGLSTAIGCYMFCVETSKNMRPWYVGMTRAKGGFASEAFQGHKLGIYNEVIGERRGKPMLFLFPLMTPTNRFSKGGESQKRVIGWLERYLMMTAFARNPEIANVRDMTFLRQVEVLGVLGKRTGRPHREVEQVRRALFGTTHRLDESEG